MRPPNAPQADDPLLADLTPAQREAVTHTEGPLLVLAAAGSGKTRVITRRIAYLVRRGVPPWAILALTFTNKAAGEMRTRTAGLLGEDAAVRGLTVTTFHSLCARLLRRFADRAGLRPDFTIYDADDQATLVKRVMADAGLSAGNWPPRSVLSVISRAKNQLCDAEAFAAAASDFQSRMIAKVFRAYASALRAANAVDFDDLLLLTARVLRDDADARGACRRRWRYLLIDEYQDTNHAQFVIASMLAGTGEDGPPNICVVGDPDQSIYGWRGADIANILEFEQRYPDARVIPLGENFRSTAPILAAADALIRNNRRRKHKDLYTRRSGGEPVEVVLCADADHEARLVTDWLAARHEEGMAWRDLAVLYRTNALSRVVEDALRRAGIPYVIARGTAFYQREEVRHALAYLRVIANPADEVSLLRIINVPTRGIGKASLSAAVAFAAGHGVGLFEALARASSIPGVSSRAASAMASFRSMVDAWTGSGTFMGSQVPGGLADLVDRVLKDSGLEAMYRRQAKMSGSEADLERVANLEEVVSSARQFEAEFDAAGDPASEDPGGQPAVPPLLALLRAYLESVALVADADAVDPEQGAVTLMTLHAAKGLEYPGVAIIGLEEGTLPLVRGDDSDADIEEERRLCFVGMTRAMRRLVLTCAASRFVRGMRQAMVPSRFVSEIGSDGVRRLDAAGWDDEGEGQDEAGGLRYEEDPFCDGLRKGSVVRHPRFGLGRVLSVERGSRPLARVEFEHVGTKTLLLEYARLTVVSAR